MELLRLGVWTGRGWGGLKLVLRMGLGLGGVGVSARVGWEPLLLHDARHDDRVDERVGYGWAGGCGQEQG